MSDLDVKGIAARQRAFLESQFLSKLGTDQGSSQAFSSQLERLADEYGKYLVSKTPEVLNDLKLKASGDLAQSGQFDLILKGNEILSIRFYLADHWVNVHYGEKRSRQQGAKPPPLHVIENWISMKGIQIRESADQSVTDVLALRKSAAIRIQQAIWNRGYTVKRFGRQGSQFVNKIVDQQSLDALAQLMAEFGAVAVAFDILSVIPRNPKNGPRLQ